MRVFWIFLLNVIEIDLYNTELYRFKVCAFFETQCNLVQPVMLIGGGWDDGESTDRRWRLLFRSLRDRRTTDTFSVVFVVALCDWLRTSSATDNITVNGILITVSCSSSSQGLLSLCLVVASWAQWKMAGGGVLLRVYAKLLSPEVLL